MKIRSILFDLGQTVIRFDWSRALQQIHQKSRKSPACLFNYLEKETAYDQYERGLLTTEQFFQHMGRQFEFQGRWQELQQIYNDIFEPWPEREQILIQLKQNYSLAAVSNTSPTHIEF